MHYSTILAYISRHLKVYERDYFTYYLELAIMVFSLKIWSHFLYGVHVDIYSDHKILQYIFVQQKLNLWQRRWLYFVKDYDMSRHYHIGKANVVADALSKLSMGSLSHVDEEYKVLVNDIHRLAK